MGLDITGLSSVADLAKTVVNKFWPDKTEAEKAAAALELQTTINEFQLAQGQLNINLEEAKSSNWFVAGWRPFIGWVCGAGLAYQFLFMPIVNGLISAIWHITPFITLDMSTLISCLGGILGLGAMRTYEKKTGVENRR